MPDASLTLPADLQAPAVVRRYLDIFLTRYRMTGDRGEEVLLAVTEAVTNACRHAYPDGEDGGVTISVEGAPGAVVEVVVVDHGVGAGLGPSADPGAGFGVRIMRELADCRYALTDAGGTTVTLRFAPVA